MRLLKPINTESLGRCPCGLEIYADAERGVVEHEIPGCKAFHDLDPLAFLIYVRQSRGIPAE